MFHKQRFLGLEFILKIKQQCFFEILEVNLATTNDSEFRILSDDLKFIIALLNWIKEFFWLIFQTKSGLTLGVGDFEYWGLDNFTNRRVRLLELLDFKAPKLQLTELNRPAQKKVLGRPVCKLSCDTKNWKPENCWELMIDSVKNAQLLRFKADYGVFIKHLAHLFL